MAIFHIAYIDHAGRVTQQLRQDAEQVMADVTGKQLVDALTPLLNKPLGSHTFGFQGGVSATMSLQWQVSVQGSATLQIASGERVLCVALLLTGIKPEVDRTALAAFHETISTIQKQAGAAAAEDVLSLKGRPLVLALVWDPALSNDDRQALGAALVSFATAWFRHEGTV